MSIFPLGGALELQRLICFKYHNVLKWNSPFQYNIIFETYQSLEPPSSNLEGDRHVHPQTFLRRIQCSTTFIWSIFWYNAYFWQCEVPIWLLSRAWTLYFKRWQSLEPPNSTSVGDRHMRPLIFLYGIQCSTTFIWSIVGCNVYFWQCGVPMWIYFPIFKHYNISKMVILGAP